MRATVLRHIVKFGQGVKGTVATYVSMSELASAAEAAGGRAYLVGGCVRDELMGRAVHDRDVVLVGISRDEVSRVVGDAAPVGRCFPVWRVRVGDEMIEIALARTETKVASGHRGFDVDFGPDIAIEHDLARRDLTINAIARDLSSGEMIDPFGGAADIEQQIARAVSEHFIDDPLRAVRAARFAAVLELDIEPSTLELMARCRDELATLSEDRKFGELARALEARRPSLFFRALRAADLLGATYPFIGALVGKMQPAERHPEGDAFEHSMIVVDRMAASDPSPVARFAALMHDVGKGRTPAEYLPRHPGHDVRGGEAVRDLPTAYPRAWRRAASVVARQHMRVKKMTEPDEVLDLLLDVRGSGLGVESFARAVYADGARHIWFLESAVSDAVLANGIDIPSEIAGDGAAIAAFVRGERIKKLRGMIPRSELDPVLL